MLQPIRDRIVVKKADEMKQTDSGLFIPSTTTQKPDRGTVIAVGTGKMKPNGDIIPMEVNVGDTVIFVTGTGQEVEVNKEKFLIMTEADILARVA